jgi:hypothetical protein
MENSESVKSKTMKEELTVALCYGHSLDSVVFISLAELADALCPLLDLREIESRVRGDVLREFKASVEKMAIDPFYGRK